MPNHIQNRLQIVGSQKQIEEVLAFVSDIDEEGQAIQMNFDKILPMPEELNIEVHSGIETWVKICFGKYNFKALISNASAGKSYGEVWNKDGFDNMIDYMGASSAFEALLGDRDNIAKLDDKDFDIFLKALSNQRKYGYMYWYEWRRKNWDTKWNAYQQNDKRNTTDTIYFQTAWSGPVKIMAKLSELFPLVTLLFDFADEDSGSNVGLFQLKAGSIVKKHVPDNQSKQAYEIFFDLHPDSKANYKLVGDKYEYIDEEE